MAASGYIESGARTPSGSGFRIEEYPFLQRTGIRSVLFTGNSTLDERYYYDWPMLYILTNSQEAYVGQTRSIIGRMIQHGNNPEKGDFTQANIIFNAEFNHSVLDDYEHRLIECMHADGKYKLTNKNGGISDSNYFSKEEYSKMFESLWAQMRDLGLATKSLAEIEDSEVFKYSPFKALNADQRDALYQIKDAIDAGLDNAQPIVVEGMPGTGKTVLAVYLLKLLKDDKKYAGLNIRLLEPVTSLRHTLQQSLNAVAGLSPNDIIGPTDLCKTSSGFVEGGKGFDILLVDETHRLKQRKNIAFYPSFDNAIETLGLPKGSPQIDWVLAQAKLPIFFWDPLQTVGPSGIGETIINDRLSVPLKSTIKLESQMRVKGGNGYLELISSILYKETPKKCTFDNYDFVLHDDFSDFCNSFEQTYAEHSLSRMIAGYAWKWKTKDKKYNQYPDLTDIEIEGIGKRWNVQPENWVGLGFNNDQIAHEVGCIHSIQGYDLSYAYVIIGNDMQYDPANEVITVSEQDYFDVNGKRTATYEELLSYIKNIYYVLLTRGINGTHVYICNGALREYFKEKMTEAGI